MKTLISILILVLAIAPVLKAQQVNVDVKTVGIVNENVSVTDTVKVQKDKDTTVVRIGKKDVKVINHNGGTEILWGKDHSKKDHSEKFKGHWQGFDFGFNGFTNPDYSMYNVDDFMAVNQGKSYELGFNLYELNIGISKSYVGLVSGFGLTFNDYKFDNRYTIRKGPDRIEPVYLDQDNLSKTKLSIVYLNVPLLLEFQIPVNNNEGRVYINAGLEGGVKLGSHTKVKHGGTKEKDHSGFNINSFKYDATARVGYKNIGLYAKYSLNSLFQDGKGPVLTPFTLGVSFGD